MNKKIILASLLIMSLSLVSCTKEEVKNTPTNQEESVGGKGGQSQGMKNGQGMMRPEVDLESAAEKLGVTEEELEESLNLTDENGRPDMEQAAEELGVSLEELREVLGMPEGGLEGGMRQGRESSESGRPKIEE